MSNLSIPGAVAVWNPKDSLVDAGSRDFELSNSERFTRALESTYNPGDSDFWVAAWVKHESISTTAPGRSHGIFELWTVFGDRAWALKATNPSGTNTYSFLVRNAADTANSEVETTGPSSTTVWYFVIAYHDASANTLGISRDGATFTTLAHSSGIKTATSTVLKIGHANDGSIAQYMDGLISNCALGRPPSGSMTTLADEIRDALYNNGQGLQWDEITPSQRISWGLTPGNGVFYPLNELSGNALDAVNGLDLTDTNTVAAGASLRTKVLDWSSNRNHGTPSGVTLSALYDSDIPTALSGSETAWSGVFDGTDDYLNCGSPSECQIDYGDSFEFECYFKSTDTAATIFAYRQEAGDSEGYRFTIRDTGQFLVLLDEGANQSNVQTSTALNDGNWHHVKVVATDSNASNWSLYVDGVLDTPTINTNTLDGTALSYSGASMYVGKWFSDFYGGNLADIKLTINGTLVFQMDFREGPGSGYASSDTIAYIPDSAGGSELKQATSASRPTINSSSQVKPALIFDGTDDLLTGSDAAEIDAIATSDMTVLAWVKVAANTGSTDAIVSKIAGTAGTDAGFFVGVNSSSDDGLLVSRICDGTTSVVSTADGSAIDDGTWHHVAVVFDRSANMTRYVDGVTTGSADSISAASGSIANARELMVGGRDATAGDDMQLNGQLGTVAIYDSALTVEQIRQIMDETDPQTAYMPRGILVDRDARQHWNTII